MPAVRWRRVVARLVDTAIAVVAGVVVGEVAAFLLTVTLLDVVPVARWGTSPGRRLAGIRVVGPDGLAPGWARAWLRHATLSPLLVGAVRRAHDRVALTAVVQGPTGPVLPVPGPLPRPPAGGGDVATAVWAGVWVSAVAATVALAFGAGLGTTAYFTVLLPAQSAGSALVVVAVARVKGSGDWRADFGWDLRLRDIRWMPLGPALQIAIAIVMVPILDGLGIEPSQEVTEEVQRAVSPLEAIAAYLTVAVLAPLEEEVLFRGILLRAQLRRFTEARALVWNGVAFGAVHLLDPGTAGLVPGLMFFGWVQAYLTVRSGTISRAVFVHAGLNVFAVTVSLLL